MSEPSRCGFVALIGAPNVGKSTLLNRLIGSKISIVSPKVQTTRRRVLGILGEGAAQIVFVDTPGIFAPRRRLDRAMVHMAWRSAGDADLVKAVAGRLPEGPWHYPADQVSDMPLREIAAEIAREQLFCQLHAELPYALTVEQESWEDFADGSLRIGQQIIVARESQRAIVLGEGGSRIKSVRQAAQSEISALTGRKVHLFLHVKFRENWQDDPERYRAMGLDFDD